MSLMHQELDRRSLSFDRVIVYLIDHDPDQKALKAARANLKRWMEDKPNAKPFLMWDEILKQPWSEVRKHLLDGVFRANAVFASILALCRSQMHSRRHPPTHHQKVLRKTTASAIQTAEKN